jgi:serine/threonine protein kinase
MAPEVINNENYDTKADVYSLGVIFKELFDLEKAIDFLSSKKSHLRSNDDKNTTNLLESKYNKSIELFDKIYSYFPQRRPDCQAILHEKNSWALNEEELEKELNEELKDFINSKVRENESTIYSMLRSKISSQTI